MLFPYPFYIYTELSQIACPGILPQCLVKTVVYKTVLLTEKVEGTMGEETHYLWHWKVFIALFST